MKNRLILKLLVRQAQTHKNNNHHKTRIVSLLTILTELIMTTTIIMKLKRYKLETGSFIEKRVMSF